MEVVHHQIGSPKKMMIAQNEATTRLRIRMLSNDSGGGCFFDATPNFAVELDARETSLLVLLVPSSIIVKYDAVSRNMNHV